MSKLVYTYWGAGIALGIYGTRDEVQQNANRLYNFNGTDSNPIWQSEGPKNAFAYVLTDWKRLKKAYADMLITGWQNDPATSEKFKGKKAGYMPIAEKEAERLIALITSENFLDGQDASSVVYVMPKLSSSSELDFIAKTGRNEQ